MKNSLFKNFTNLYSLSKTLKFELIPEGKTEKTIEAKNLLKQDEERALNYQTMKNVIDEYHKLHIKKSLSSAKLSNLVNYEQLYYHTTDNADQKAKDERKKAIELCQADLRKEVVKYLTAEGEAKERYKNLFKEELIEKLLEPFVEHYNTIKSEHKEDLTFIPDFAKFTTYFSGFHDNRKNMYSDKDQSTAIAYRIIHENLPKFLDNIKTIISIKNNHNELYLQLETGINEVAEGAIIENIFVLEGFNQVLNQDGISIYNDFIGGRSLENQTKIKGINEIINAYNQQKQLKAGKRVAKLKLLYKQILSDRTSSSFVIDNFTDDNDVKTAIENYYVSSIESLEVDGKQINTLHEIKNLCDNIRNYDLDKIYIQSLSRKEISNRIYGYYGVIDIALNDYYDNVINPTYQELFEKKKSEDARSKFQRLRQNELNQPYSIMVLQNILNTYMQKLEEDNAWKVKHQDDNLISYFGSYFYSKESIDSEKKINLVANIEDKYRCVKGVLATQHTSNNDSRAMLNDEKLAADIKKLLDAILELANFIKPMMVAMDDKDEVFYNQLQPLYEELKSIIPLYNKTRNYLTQKPYDKSKIKLNFENATLLAGWDKNKEKDNSGVLLIKDGHYYLSIMAKGHNKIFDEISEENLTDKNNQYFQKVDYKLLPGANKMLPKVFLSKKGIENYNPSSDIIDGYRQGNYKKGDSFDIKFMYRLIDYFKISIKNHPSWKDFNHQFSPTINYQNISEFYKEVEHQGYKISYRNISKTYIDKCVDDGCLFLFRIYNKDFSKHATGKENLHTMYWKALFDKNNLSDVQYKLNGKAEIFYRKTSIPKEKKVIHYKNVPINLKNPNYDDQKSTFSYDIIKDARFTRDSYHFHVPITMNFKAEGNSYNNHRVLDALKEYGDTHVIGIDRGERNLLYISVIDSQGHIVEQKDLNNIIYKVNGKKKEVPYHKLLSTKQLEREQARINWSAIENIKELKAGYLSIVVHEIATLMMKYNAVVILEDLNFGFKRGRFKFEKQVYQKFERALIDKLNFLVLKDKSDTELAGKFNALQLTNKFESFEKLGKQCGFLFYVPAWNTSKIDPATGFVDLLKPIYERESQASEWFQKFDRINYNNNKDYFEFSFNYSNFHNRAEGTKENWVLCSFGDTRYSYFKDKNASKGSMKKINVTEELKKIFEGIGVDYKNGSNLLGEINGKGNVAFYRGLVKCLQVLLALRYSNEDDDFILSPVANSNGEFFDSRKMKAAYENNNKAPLPIDADANGAYNIAKKGLWALQQVKTHSGDDWKGLKLAISNRDWLAFVQNKK